MKSTTFGKCLTETRKVKQLTVDDLAKKLEARGTIIGRYERAKIETSMEMAAAISEALEVSLDYLVSNIGLLREKSVVIKIIDIQSLNPEDKVQVFALLDAVMQSHKAKKYPFLDKK